jgi:MCP family monocarboxylic acid transporter-like MFS transporter 10
LFLQGIAYAIGGAILYAPCISYMPEHFVARRGLANGILFAGTAVGGLVLPLILPVLINAWGIPVTLRVLSVAIVVALVPVLPFVKGRLPTAGARASAPKDTRWRRTPSFWALIAVNTLQGLSYFVPVLYISSECSSTSPSHSLISSICQLD